MTRLRFRSPLIVRLTVPLAVLALTALAGPPAYADESAEASAAITAFESGEHVYVSAEAGQEVNADAVTGAVDEKPVFVAVVPPNTPPQDVLVLLREEARQAGTYVVISGTEHAAHSSVICSTQAQPLLDEAAESQAEPRAEGDLTPFLLDYLQRIDSAPKPGDDACSDEVDDAGTFWSTAPWILGALVLSAGGGYLWLRYRRRAKAAQDVRGRQRVAGALDVLARDIDAVTDERDPQVALALHDARERHIAAADILADADAASDFDAALRAAREGAAAAYFARERAGLPATRPAEVEPAHARRVADDELVEVGDQQVLAHRDYQPGAPYFFSGTPELPAGWYPVPVGSDELLRAISDDE